MEENFEKFMEYCEEYLQNAVRKFLSRLRKRYDECNEAYKESKELLDDILRTKEKIRGDSLKFFAHLRELYNLLRENRKKELKTGNNNIETKRSKSKRSSDSAENEIYSVNYSKRRKTDVHTGCGEVSQHITSQTWLKRSSRDEMTREISNSNLIVSGVELGQEETFYNDVDLADNKAESIDKIHSEAENANELYNSENTVVQYTNNVCHSEEGNRTEMKRCESDTDFSMNEFVNCIPDEKVYDTKTSGTQMHENVHNKQLMGVELQPRVVIKDNINSLKAKTDHLCLERISDRKSERKTREVDTSKEDSDRSSYFDEESFKSENGDIAKKTLEIKNVLPNGRKLKICFNNRRNSKKTFCRSSRKVNTAMGSKSRDCLGKFMPQAFSKTAKSKGEAATSKTLKRTFKGKKGDLPKKTSCIPVTIVTDNDSDSDFVSTQDYSKKNVEKEKQDVNCEKIETKDGNDTKKPDRTSFPDGKKPKGRNRSSDRTTRPSDESKKKPCDGGISDNFKNKFPNQSIKPTKGKTFRKTAEERKRRPLRNDMASDRQRRKEKAGQSKTRTTLVCDTFKDGNYNKRIKQLEDVYKDILNEVEKINRSGIEMEDDYEGLVRVMRKYLLQRKCMKVWNQLCLLQKYSGSTRRSAERQFNDRGLRTADVSEIFEYFRKSNTVPVYTDLMDFMVEVNKDKRLHLSSQEIKNLSKEIFTDVTNQLEIYRSQINFTLEPETPVVDAEDISSDDFQTFLGSTGKKRKFAKPQPRRAYSQTNTPFSFFKQTDQARHSGESTTDDDLDSQSFTRSGSSTIPTNKPSGHQHSQKIGKPRVRLQNESTECDGKHTSSRSFAKDYAKILQPCVRIKQEKSLLGGTKVAYLGRLRLQPSSFKDTVVIVTDSEGENETYAYATDGEDEIDHEVKYLAERRGRHLRSEYTCKVPRATLKRRNRETSLIHGWKEIARTKKCTRKKIESSSRSDNSSDSETWLSTLKRRKAGSNYGEVKAEDSDSDSFKVDTLRSRKQTARFAKLKAKTEISKQNEELNETSSTSSAEDECE